MPALFAVVERDPVASIEFAFFVLVFVAAAVVAATAPGSSHLWPHTHAT